MRIYIYTVKSNIYGMVNHKSKKLIKRIDRWRDFSTVHKKVKKSIGKNDRS